jgi:small subunit ribosomal protein S11
VSEATSKKKRVKRVKRNVPVGIVNVSATFNNTIVTFADSSGATIAWSSSGAKGFKGNRRGTPFAAQVAGEEAARKAVESGMRSCAAIITGPGAGRESALRAIAAVGIRITSIKDKTPVPHNGCRPPKRRRV